jgi:hypothetical protein
LGVSNLSEYLSRRVAVISGEEMDIILNSKSFNIDLIKIIYIGAMYIFALLYVNTYSL